MSNDPLVRGKRQLNYNPSYSESKTDDMFNQGPAGHAACSEARVGTTPPGSNGTRFNGSQFVTTGRLSRASCGYAKLGGREADADAHAAAG